MRVEPGAVRFIPCRGIRRTERSDGYAVRMAGLRTATAMSPLARLLLFAALVVGVVTMHALVVGCGHVAPRHTVTAADQGANRSHSDSDQPCDVGDCAGHSAFHTCLFVMTAIPTIAGLVLLYWVGVSGSASTAPQRLQGQARRQRAPPWTVLSLPELSILRV